MWHLREMVRGRSWKPPNPTTSTWTTPADTHTLSDTYSSSSHLGHLGRAPIITCRSVSWWDTYTVALASKNQYTLLIQSFPIRGGALRRSKYKFLPSWHSAQWIILLKRDTEDKFDYTCISEVGREVSMSIKDKYIFFIIIYLFGSSHSPWLLHPRGLSVVKGGRNLWLSLIKVNIRKWFCTVGQTPEHFHWLNLLPIVMSEVWQMDARNWLIIF